MVLIGRKSEHFDVGLALGVIAIPLIRDRGRFNNNYIVLLILTWGIVFGSGHIDAKKLVF